MVRSISMDFDNVNVIDKSLSPLCYLPSGRLVCYRYGHVLIIEDGKIAKNILVLGVRRSVS